MPSHRVPREVIRGKEMEMVSCWINPMSVFFLPRCVRVKICMLQDAAASPRYDVSFVCVSTPTSMYISDVHAPYIAARTREQASPCDANCRSAKIKSLRLERVTSSPLAATHWVHTTKRQLFGASHVQHVVRWHRMVMADEGASDLPSLAG